MRKLSDWTGKEWYHQRFDGAPYFIHFIPEAQIRRDPRKDGGEFSVHYCFFENGKADWYMLVEEIRKITDSIMLHADNDLSYTKRLMSRWETDEKKFYTKCDEIKGVNLELLPNDELMGLHDEFVEMVLNRNSSSSIIDGFALGTDEMIAKKVETHFEKSSLRSKMRLMEVFSVATAPIHLSFINNAEIELLNIAAEVKINPDRQNELLKAHQSKYFWTRNNYVDANILSVEDFIEELGKILSVYPDPAAEAERVKNVPIENKNKKTELFKELEPDPELKFLIKASEDITKWQDERKEATYWTIHYGCLILKEIAGRVGLPFELLKYMSPREMSGIFDRSPQKKELEARQSKSVFYWDIEGHETLVGGEADDVKNKILVTVDLSKVDDFRGLTACLGKAIGKAKLVKSVKEIGKVEEGDILVAVMTRPDYVPAMKKAAAIVTDEGGVTSHAAIVARELNKPCIIGTKIATKVLKDGQTVEVKANHGWVKILKHEQG